MPIRIISIKESFTVTLPSPVLLVQPDESYSIGLQGSTFIYARPTLQQMRRCDRIARNGNLVNDDIARDERLKLCLKDWQGVEDGEGGEVKFDKAIVSLLPGSIKAQLDNAFGAQLPEQIVITEPHATFEVRRLTSAQHNTILNKHTQRGVLDRFGAMEAMLQAAILSWQGVLRDTGDGSLAGVAHDQELISLLPQQALVPVLEAIQSHTTAMEADLGN